jgi:SAM-dependent methyltransferase
MPSHEAAAHERIISTFYDAHPYPWQPMYLDSMSEPDLFEVMLRQETGRRNLASVRAIWVAGCGTNQALITALQYPQASVLGTDLADRSLEICADNARRVGVTNLRLCKESLLDSDRRDAFDLIICTGVIHHSRQPRECLTRLAAALRPDGLLELMVYNRFHRRPARAFQAAMGLLADDLAPADPHRRALAAELATSVPDGTETARILREMADTPPAAWADYWLNPYESDFTVDSLWSLASECGLLIEAPKVNAFDKAYGRFLWAIDLPPGELRQRYLGLDDRARYQLVNLLHLDRSPLLWFYLRPVTDASSSRVTDADRNRWFLESAPMRSTAERRRHVLHDDGRYTAGQRSSALAGWRPRADVRSVWAAADGRRTGAQLMRDAGLDDDFTTVMRTRVLLTTPECPYLVLPPH